jgi:phage host-nuclease inhibitor protein Gam
MRESPEGTMELKTWEDAEIAATDFAELTSQLEIIKEELREFCERRHDAVGKARVLGPAIVGFRKEPAAVIVPDEEPAIAAFDRLLGGRFVRSVKKLDRTMLKSFLQGSVRPGDGKAIDALTLVGIHLRAATEKFYVKLARQGSGDL